MNKIKVLHQFVKDNLNFIEPSSSSGIDANYPDFDLYPKDFLLFAKLELEQSFSKESNTIHIINCLSHLKRALDCQMDLFLYQINLYQIKESKNLGFTSKLDFIKSIGFIEASSINRLNNLRNKLEHHYKIPIINDLEVYFDLVSAFISVIESKTHFLLNHHQVQIESTNIEKFYYFDLNYVIDKSPSIIFKVTYKDKEKDSTITVTPAEREEFSYYLKVLVLLINLGYLRKELILEELTS